MGNYPGGLAKGRVFKRIQNLYKSKPLIIPAGPSLVRRAGIISVGGAHNIADAIENNLDLYITGEAAERVVQLSREENMHFVAAGHYASERLGIKALTEYINKNFKVDAEFVDLPVPV